MKKFALKLLVFGIPAIVFLAPPIAALKLSGEYFTGIDQLVESKEKYLIGYAYNEENSKYLKWKEVTSRPKQTILSLGSSRVLQFRKEMFQSSFYNAGFTIQRMGDFLSFLLGIPKDNYPDVLVIGLDQWLFNEKWDLKKPKSKSAKWQPEFNLTPSFKTLISVWNDLIKEKYSIFSFPNNNKIKNVGIASYSMNRGFRSDGSFLYGNQIPKLLNYDTTAYDYNYNLTLARIKNGAIRFEHGEDLYTNSLAELEFFLHYCKKNNIYVIAFLPPFADKVNERMKQTGKHTYMPKIYPSIIPLFQKNGFELWDMSNLSTYQSGDTETIDGYHGSEVTYLKMLIYMAENGSIISKHTSLAKLQEDLENKINNYMVYDY
ncbi:MAG: hypothetical protein KKD31_19730 [Bacteroidetes bacterium]|nr:hypothetical protein [Bacteroidota bacterium]